MKKIYQVWKKGAFAIGNFQTSILFSILYLILFTPIGVISSFFGDFLSNKKAPHWHKMTHNPQTLKEMIDQ